LRFLKSTLQTVDFFVMQKTKALCLFWLFVVFNLELHELLKIPYLIQHFQQHQNLSLSEFVHTHYHHDLHTDAHHHSVPHTHSDGEKPHGNLPTPLPHQHSEHEHKLPFSKTVNYFSLLVFIPVSDPVFNPLVKIFTFITSCQLIVKNKFLAFIRWFCSGYKLALFRPPC